MRRSRPFFTISATNSLVVSPIKLLAGVRHPIMPRSANTVRISSRNTAAVLMSWPTPHRGNRPDARRNAGSPSARLRSTQNRLKSTGFTSRRDAIMFLRAAAVVASAMAGSREANHSRSCEPLVGADDVVAEREHVHGHVLGHVALRGGRRYADRAPRSNLIQDIDALDVVRRRRQGRSMARMPRSIVRRGVDQAHQPHVGGDHGRRRHAACRGRDRRTSIAQATPKSRRS